MVGDVRFNDLVRIYQIRGRPRKDKFQVSKVNKNFEEFTDVYREVLLDDSPGKLRSCFVNPTRSRYGERYPKKPLQNIKKIHLEMPILGTENAIVPSPPKTPEKKTPKKQAEKRDQSLTTEDQITKWNIKDSVKVKANNDGGSIKDTHLLLKQTKQDIAESAQQLEAIQTFINEIKPPARIRKSRSPTYKSKKKSERHSDCMSKKYVSTLNTMQQKLKKLEEKYFSKPHVIYKNVRDIYTTSSDIDILYENNASADTEDITETLQGIKQELDFIANSCLEKEEKNPKKAPQGVKEDLDFIVNSCLEKQEKKPKKSPQGIKQELDFIDNSYLEKGEKKPKKTPQVIKQELDFIDNSYLEKEDKKPKKNLERIKQELDFTDNSCLEKEEKKPKKTVTFKAPEVEFNTVGDTFDEDKNISPTNFSFKKPVGFDEEQAQEGYSKIIDQSENWFKKYFTKHFDVEQFCKEVCNLDEEDEQSNCKVEAQKDALGQAPTVEECDRGMATDDSDKESHDSEVDNFYREDKSVFFSKELQEVISSSSYLSREFEKAKPSVKVFFNTDNYLRGKFFGVPSKTSNSVDPSITDLIDNLSLSLKGSIYYKANT